MISAVITCAGNHSRFGINKLFELLGGEPVFIKTLRQFERSKKVDEVVVAVPRGRMDEFKKLIKKAGIKVKVVAGGRERYVSAYNGVKASKGEYVLIHDGARPLVSVRLIDKVVREVKKHGAVMAAVETHTCVKYINKKNYDVQECLPRAKTWLGQTPHAFKREIILKAYEGAMKKKYEGMDDCELVRKSGGKVKVIEGDWRNTKITVPSDLVVVREYWKLRGGEDV